MRQTHFVESSLAWLLVFLQRKFASDIFGGVNKGGWAIAILSLIVGMFGVANIMFVTVRERVFFLDRPDNFRERRMKKDGTIYDTFACAKTAMVEDAKMRVKYAEAEWQRCKDWLKKCNDMKAPN